jgi:uncharacterized protein (TIGR03435 family)
MWDDARIVRSVVVVLLAIACCGPAASTQASSAAGHASAAGPDYDVATVKVNNSGSGSIHINISDDILQATNVPLSTLLEIAFDIRRDQIVGLPHWAQVEHYDIAARVVDMDPRQVHSLSDDQERAMLQHLLDQRFHLQAHVEKRPLPLLELTATKGGAKFDEWKVPADGQESNKGSIRVNDDELDELTAVACQWTG